MNFTLSASPGAVQLRGVAASLRAPPAPLNFTALEDALRAWVVNATGLGAGAVVFGHQPFLSPAPGPMIAIIVDPPQHVGGPDAEDHDFDAARPLGQEIHQATQGVRRLPVELQAVAPPVTGSPTARDLVQRCQASLGLTEVRQTLNDAGLGVISEGSPRWIPTLSAGGFEGRAVLESVFTVRETATTRLGYIATVRGSLTVEEGSQEKTLAFEKTIATP